MDTIKPTPQASFSWTAKDGKWALNVPKFMVQARICDGGKVEVLV